MLSFSMVGTNVIVSNSVWLKVLVVPFLTHSFSMVGMNVMSNGNRLKVVVVPLLMHSFFMVGINVVSNANQLKVLVVLFLPHVLLVSNDDVNHPSLVVVAPCWKHQQVHFPFVGTMVFLVFLQGLDYSLLYNLF